MQASGQLHMHPRYYLFTAEGSPNYLKVRRYLDKNTREYYNSFMFLNGNCRFIYVTFKETHLTWRDELSTGNMILNFNAYNSQEASTRTFVDFSFDPAYECGGDQENDNLIVVLERQQFPEGDFTFNVFLCRIQDDSVIRKIIRIEDQKFNLYETRDQNLLYISRTDKIPGEKSGQRMLKWATQQYPEVSLIIQYYP